MHTFAGTVKLATEGTAGRDAWFGIRWRRKTAKGQQSSESAATLTLGSMFFARFSTNLQRQIDLTNAFKTIFRDDSFKQCSKIAGFLGVLGGARARLRARPRERQAKGHKVWNLPRPLPWGVCKGRRQRPCPGPGGPCRPNLTVLGELLH